MKRTMVAAVHTGYWGSHVFACSLLLLMLRGPRATSAPLVELLPLWPLVLIAIAPGAAAFYAAYGPLFSRSLVRRRLSIAIAGAAGISLAAAAFGLLLAVLLFGARQPVFSRGRELAVLTIAMAAVAAAHVTVGLLVRGFLRWWRPDTAAEPARPISAPLPIVSPPLDVIFVKTEQRLEKIRLDEILVIEGQRDYRRIHTTTRRIMTLQTFAEFERQLNPELICRVHKSYMVAVRQIDAIERGRIAIHGLSVPISGTYRDRFFERIGQR
jgi:DNA-binding LytR/AlgR family response regulator